MSELASFAAVTFSAVFFVVDPIALVPVFLAMTRDDPPAKKRATATKAALASTLALLVFAAAGGFIFDVFGITLGAFKIAGGVVLFLIALDMMRAQSSRVRTTPEEEEAGVEKDDVAIVPLAIPMLAGPGSIATVMVVMSNAGPHPARIAAVVGVIVVTGVLSWLVLRSAVLVERRLGRTGLNILNRVMGLMLAAVAVQFVVTGVRDVLPQITGGPAG